VGTIFFFNEMGTYGGADLDLYLGGVKIIHSKFELLIQ